MRIVGSSAATVARRSVDVLSRLVISSLNTRSMSSCTGMLCFSASTMRSGSVSAMWPSLSFLSAVTSAGSMIGIFITHLLSSA
jgi:hypothetical protein